MSLNKDLTIIFVSYYSKELIEKPLKKINDDIQVLVVENSADLTVKQDLESKYPNVKVIIPKENTGNGGGINIGLNLVNTKYAFYLDIDTVPDDTTIPQLYAYANKIKNFSILGPSVNGFKYKEEFYNKKNTTDKVHSMNFMTGCALFFNMEIIKKIGFFDQNIFLYYEENDLYLRCLKQNKPIYLIDDAKIDHLGNSSSDKKFKHEIEVNSNWHLMWSTFYFHKKHYGLIKAYEKTLFKFFSAIAKFLFYSLINQKEKRLIYFSRISGIFNAMLGKKSWYRPKINKL